MSHVVTCFVRSRGAVLLVRRSDAVGTYSGRWGGVSGYVEGDPADAERDARRELREEVGLADADLELVRAGAPLSVDDDEGSFTVHPFLFECDARDLTTNEEIAAVDWVDPTDIRGRATVPRLWETWRRVAPTVETVAADQTHGSAWISARALEVLRDAAAETVDADGSRRDVAAVARRLRDARPEMAVVANRVNRVLATATRAADPSGVDFDPNDVVDAAVSALGDAFDADAAAAAAAAARLRRDGSTSIATLSRSGTVREALSDLERDGPGLSEIVVAESRPEREGVAVAERAAGETDADVTLTTEAALPTALEERDTDAVLVGADAILPSGDVVNKTGTRVLALAAREADVPLYAVAATDKVLASSEAVIETSVAARADVESPADAVYDGDADVGVHAPTFETTAAALVDGVATEDGLLTVDEIGAVADEHARNAAWDE
ncbi:NUDIX domain-containing protein [Halobellus rufus]|uniref:NUDIX domain-containing protein n=1 Tax=Halobellus rufus TaxID=1448860 RepID=UPI000678A87D|nr:NUDIX domain-containing protein [Halobellus rufus]